MPINANLKLFSFWAKTGQRHDADFQVGRGTLPDFHPLIYHLLDVAACAEALLRSEQPRVKRLAKYCNANLAELSGCLVALIALHDIGKLARGFQGKVVDLWPDFLGPKPDKELSVRHDAAGLWLFCEDDNLAKVAEKILPDLCPSKRLKMIQAVCGHHGEPIDTGFGEIGNHKKTIGPKASEAAAAIAAGIVELLQPPVCPLKDRYVPLASFWLAGLAVLADWLGSNRTWFEFQHPPMSSDLVTNMATYWETYARPGAARALTEAGLLPASVSPRTGLAHLFGANYEATPMQNYAESVDLPDGPLLFIIEDMTGAGKTEAAVILAHRLMLSGKARGLYIALPTMATANAMFTRLASSYRRLFDKTRTPSIVLTHGRRELFTGFTHLPASVARYDGDTCDEDDPSEIEASAFCADWLARSNKQAFLAQIGAGTIDQAILSILPARHQSLRLWGLADKVLVIDEAHAYDAYMSKEIECLLEFHAAFGGSAIVLSATLPQDKRAALANAFLKGAKKGEQSTWRPSESAYPLVTSISLEKIEDQPLALRDSLAREVKVQRIDTLDKAHVRGLEAAKQGAAVAIIRNTVDEAFASYEAISRHFDRVLLFHARFAMADRQEIESKVLDHFGKDNNSDRNTILVATQVIEQSLDLDFDLVISDLAPVDLLIQRAGRLWRHARRRRPVGGPTFLVLSPTPLEEVDEHWPAPTLPKTNFVYKDAALLWRSAKAIFAAGKIVSRTSLECAPVESGEVRALVEAVYGDDALAIPPSLERSEIDAIGRASADRTIAGHKLLELETGYDWAGSKWERETKIETRLGDETITLRLARIEAGRVVPWIPADEGDPRRGWALSEVSLRKSRCSGASNPPDVQKLVEAAQHGWTLSEKETPMVVLKPAHDERWQGTARGKGAASMSVFYSKSAGLQFAGKGL